LALNLSSHLDADAEQAIDDPSERRASGAL
jgi:hypothetical protein